MLDIWSLFVWIWSWMILSNFSTHYLSFLIRPFFVGIWLWPVYDKKQRPQEKNELVEEWMKTKIYGTMINPRTMIILRYYIIFDNLSFIFVGTSEISDHLSFFLCCFFFDRYFGCYVFLMVEALPLNFLFALMSVGLHQSVGA